jgi:hypothetical protein
MSHRKDTQATLGGSSKLQGEFNFAFDQRESEVNIYKATSWSESHFNVSPVSLNNA